MDKNVYQSPKSKIEVSVARRIKTGKFLSVLGGILQIPIIVYFFIGLFDLYQTFQSITLYGEGDPKVMAGGVSAALSVVIIGTVISIPGLILSVVSLYISDYRSKWLFRYSITVSIFWIISFPVGTIPGLFYIVLVLVKRKSKYHNSMEPELSPSV